MNDSRNNKIGRIEQKILSRKTYQTDLDEIVNSPDLFKRINAGIETEESNRKSKTASDVWTIFPYGNQKIVGLAFGVLGICLAGLFFTSLFIKRDLSGSDLTQQIVTPEIQEFNLPVQNPESSPDTDSDETKISAERALNKSERTAKINFKNKAAQAKKRTAKSKSIRKSPRSEDETESEFYPLMLAEDLEEAREDGKIIRVELSRSSLLALGFNPPPESEIIKVKTDLLLGSDGVARGIRFVK